MSSIGINRRRVNRDPLSGEPVQVMAGLVLDELLRFKPQSEAEQAVRDVALKRAQALYWDAKELATDVAWLNTLMQEGAPPA